jgi:hypothetical protein
MLEPLLQVMPRSGVNPGSEFEECEWLSQVLGQVRSFVLFLVQS